LSIPRQKFSDLKPKKTQKLGDANEDLTPKAKKPERSWIKMYAMTLFGLIVFVTYNYYQKIEEYRLQRSRIKLLKSWIKNKLNRKKISADEEVEITSEQIEEYLENESRRRSKKESWNEISAESINSHFGKKVVFPIDKMDRIGYVQTKLENHNAKASPNPPTKVFYVVSVDLLGVTYPTSVNQLKEILKYLNEIKVDWMYSDESIDHQSILQKVSPYKHNAKLILVNTKHINHIV